MGSKKHKKHCKGRDEDSPVTPMNSSQQTTPIKLVLKMPTLNSSGAAALNSSTAAAAAAAAAASSSSSSAAAAAASLGVSAAASSVGNLFAANAEISVRLVSGAADKCPASSSVRRHDNQAVPSTAASDSLSESSYHTKQHKKSSEKKKKKKKKKHHHHCHHHHKEHHHKHHNHNSSVSSCREAEKRRDRPDSNNDNNSNSNSNNNDSNNNSNNNHSNSNSNSKKNKNKNRNNNSNNNNNNNNNDDDEDDDDDGGDGDGGRAEDEHDERPPKKRRQIPVTESVDNQPPLPTVPLRCPVGVNPTKAADSESPLQRLLTVLFNIVRERDSFEIFAWPVSDVIAPGYSSIIQRPMDLSTMRRKLEHQQYSNLFDFKTDVKLICDNATKYNTADTVYYKEAKKLWRNVQKYFTREGIFQLDPELEYIGNLTIDQLGFDVRETSPVDEPAPRVTRNRIRVTDDEEKVAIVPPMKISLAANAVEPPIVEFGAIRAKVVHHIRDEPDEGIAVQEAPIQTSFLDPCLPSDTVVETAPVVGAPAAATPLSRVNSPEVDKERAASPSVAKKSDPDDLEDFTYLTPPSDDSPPDVILAHAQKMARFAAQRLRRMRPNTQIHIVCSPEPGATSLKFVNPDLTLTEKYLGWKPKYPQVPAEEVDLEMLIGKLPYGMSSLAEFKDETRNIAKPINYLPLESGPPFSTYAPHYDSTFSNLTKAESDLIYAVYGDEIGVQYAESLLHFAKDSEETKERVDDLLDSLTDGEHRKAVGKIKSGELLRDEDEKEATGPTTEHNDEVLPARLNGGDHRFYSAQPVSSPSISTSGMAVHNESSQSPLPVMPSVCATAAAENSAVSLHDADGPSTSKVPPDQTPANGQSDRQSPAVETLDDENEQKLQSKLTESTEMIETLTKLQKERLSKAPPNNLGNVAGPSPTELRLAEKLAATLSELASHAKPGSIVSVEAIRRAMGITLPEKKVHPVPEPIAGEK